MKLAMKKKPRVPQAGDLWRHNTSFEVVHVMPDVLTRDFSWRAQHAVTLAERESLGIMPDINEDDRTPLERMTAERDMNLRALKIAAEHSDDLMGKLRQERAQHTENIHRLMFARAFAASQGRVIAGLKAGVAELVTERDGTEAGIDAAVASVVAEFERQGKCTSERMEALTCVADELGSLHALPPGAQYGNIWSGTDLAEALAALRGMLQWHEGASRRKAQAVLDKHDDAQKAAE